MGGRAYRNGWPGVGITVGVLQRRRDLRPKMTHLRLLRTDERVASPANYAVTPSITAERLNGLMSYLMRHGVDGITGLSSVNA